jgi:hypothetical protein
VDPDGAVDMRNFEDIGLLAGPLRAIKSST